MEKRSQTVLLKDVLIVTLQTAVDFVIISKHSNNYRKMSWTEKFTES